MAQCTATSKRTGNRCGAQAITGRDKCRFHGGKSLRGPAHPNWKGGRYSKFVPERMRERYEASLNDPETLHLLEQLALLDARLNDVLVRVDSGESSRAWKAALDAMTKYEEAAALQDPDAQALAWRELKKAINAGRADWETWEDVRTLIRDRKAIAESERRRKVEEHQMIAVEQAQAIMLTLIEAVRRNVDDRRVIAEIVREFDRIAYFAGKGTPSAIPDAEYRELGGGIEADAGSLAAASAGK